MLRALLAGALTAGLVGLIAVLFRRQGQELTTGQLVAICLPVALGVFLARNLLPGDGPSGPRYSAEELVDQAIRESPAVGLLVQEHPELRQNLSRLFDSLVAAGASRKAAFGAGVAWGRKVLTPYLQQYLPVASDSALLLFGEASSDMLDGLRQNPEACMDYLFGPGNRPAVQPIPPARQKQLGDAIELVIRSALAEPHPAMTPAQVNQTIKGLVTGLIGKWGPSGATALETFGSPASARQNPAASCNVAYQLYRYIVSLPEDRAATTLRALFSAR